MAAKLHNTLRGAISKQRSASSSVVNNSSNPNQNLKIVVGNRIGIITIGKIVTVKTTIIVVMTLVRVIIITTIILAITLTVLSNDIVI